VYISHAVRRGLLVLLALSAAFAALAPITHLTAQQTLSADGDTKVNGGG
jgi:hypothetical protein